MEPEDRRHTVHHPAGEQPARGSTASSGERRSAVPERYQLLAADRPSIPPRLPNAAVENWALHQLAQVFNAAPQRLLEGLLGLAVDICGGGPHTSSAGVSLLEPAPDGEEQFRWVSMAGRLASHSGGIIPRDFSPSGVCLEQGKPVLFARPDLRFEYFLATGIPLTEALVLPFVTRPGERPIGTIWVISHPPLERHFDAEDVRLMMSLATFTASAFRLANERDTAEQASKVRRDFVTTMSHELRTPLNAIAGYTELLELGIPGPVNDAQREYLERIRKSGDFVLTLVNGLLDLAKLDANASELTLAPVAINSILASMQMLIEPQIRAREITYRHAECDDSLHAIADRGRVQQIILNLLTNATKFTSRGGTVELFVTAVEEQVHIHVEDTGCGIPPARLEEVFEPFVQVDPTLNPGTQHGVGLGLSISRRLARRMGGDLVVESNLGIGSRFTLVLPRALPPQEH
jgi:signal transduction histidine kinase